MAFLACRGARLDPAQRDSLAIVWPASTAVDEGRVESVDIKVLVIDEEPFSHRRVSVLIRLNVKSRSALTSRVLLDFVGQQRALVCLEDLAFIRKYGASVPVFLRLKLREQVLN